MEPIKTQTHYNDGVVDAHYAEFDYIFGPYVVFVSCEGKSELVATDDNFFAPILLVEAYRNVFPSDWVNDEGQELAKRVSKFKEWLIETGCEPDDLKEE